MDHVGISYVDFSLGKDLGVYRFFVDNLDPDKGDYLLLDEAHEALKQIAGATKLGTGHYMIDNPFDNANVKCEAGEENAK